MDTLIIITDDNVVIVDGTAYNNIDMTGLPADLWAVQHHPLLDISEEEWMGEEINRPIDDISKYDFIVERWQVKHDLATTITKEMVYDIKVGDIFAKSTEENAKDFLYDEDMFVADQPSIQAVQNQCLTMMPSDPIPTPGGVWVLADDSEILFNVTEFKDFATAFFMRGSHNFGIKTFHRRSVDQILADDLTTIEDIENYDFSQGWL